MVSTFLKYTNSFHQSHILQAHKTMLAQLPGRCFSTQMDIGQKLSGTPYGFAHSFGTINSGMEHLAYSGCRDFSAINLLLILVKRNRSDRTPNLNC